jgi:hypothetical protein
MKLLFYVRKNCILKRFAILERVWNLQGANNGAFLPFIPHFRILRTNPLFSKKINFFKTIFSSVTNK